MLVKGANGLIICQSSSGALTMISLNKAKLVFIKDLICDQSFFYIYILIIPIKINIMWCLFSTHQHISISLNTIPYQENVCVCPQLKNCCNSLNQWHRSFHMKAALPLATRFAVVPGPDRPHCLSDLMVLLARQTYFSSPAHDYSGMLKLHEQYRWIKLLYVFLPEICNPFKDKVIFMSWI